jgi:hypothetical protein
LGIAFNMLFLSLKKQKEKKRNTRRFKAAFSSSRTVTLSYG